VVRRADTVHPSYYRGVSRVMGKGEYLGTWRARIKKGGRDLDLGTFKDPRDAARAYDDAAYELLGDKAKLNFPRKK
jgi:EREBP-like factor